MGMKKFTLLFAAVIILYGAINAQETVIIGWTFPGNSSVADTGIDVNMDKEVLTMGETSDIDFKNGFTTKAAQATEWNDGMDNKAWVVSFSTEGYSGLAISSMQSSGGNEPGPKDFKVQYSVDNGSNWMDVADGEIAVENEWITGVIDNLELPSECNDIAEVQIRWVMTSNEASGAGGPVLESGKSKIDEIYIRGDKISAIANSNFGVVMEIGPNPTTDFLNVKSDLKMQNIILCDVSGKVVLQKEVNTKVGTIYLATFPKGLYILSVDYWNRNSTYKRKIIVY